MVQYARPSSLTLDSWTGAATDIDETSPVDTDFIYSPNNPNNTVNIALSSITDPTSSIGHVLRVRLCQGDADGTTPDATGTATAYQIVLTDGTNTIWDSGSTASPGTWTTITHNLTSGEADTIASYSTLQVNVTATGGGGSPANRRDVAVSWVEFEAPNAPTVYRGYGQTQAQIISPKFAQAQASIDSGIYYVHDTFTRSVGSGWGTADSGSAWTVSNGGTGAASVNGSVGSITANQFVYYGLEQATYIRDTYVEFDFSLGNTTDTSQAIGLYTWSRDFGARIITDSGGSTAVSLEKEQTAFASFPSYITLSASTTYRFKFKLIVALDGDIFEFFKLYEVGQSEPEWSSGVTTADGFSPGYSQIYVAGGLDGNITDTFDNVTIEPTILGGHAQAMTSIDTATKVFQSAQALASIKTTYTVFAQANAYLVIVGNTFAQTNAVIGVPTGLYSFIDESSIDTTDFIISPTGTTNYAEVQLDTSGTPDYLQDIIIWFNAYRTGTQGTLDVSLYEGATQRANTSVSLAASATTYSYSLTTGEIASIVDYGNLRLRFTPSNLLSTERAVVTWATLQLPPSSAGSTKRSYANAQALVISTANVFAQSQASILRTHTVYAQAQAAILATYLEYAQSQAWIKTSYLGYAQANATIKSTYNGYAQAQALIKSTYLGFAQGQAHIKSTYIGFAQAQGTVKSTYDAYAQSQAYIKTTQNYSYAQAQAQIKQIYLVYAQAQGQVREIFTYQQFAQAQSDIKQIYQGYAQSQADILATYNGYAQTNAYIKLLRNAFAQSQASIITTYSAFAQSQASILTTYNVYAQANAAIAGSYQVHAQAQGATIATYNRHAQAQATTTQTYTVSAQANAAILKIYLVSAQAQASILATYTVSAQANALILNTYDAYAQAQAKIITTYSVFAQAQASVLQTYQNYAQAQARIEQTYSAFAQAQARIQSTYNVFAQAQAAVRGNAFAQSQAWILATYNVFAQSQAQIQQTYNVFAQAQGTVLSISVGYAQANASVLTSYEVYAQANADIQQTYTVSANAQADIRQTYQGYAQAASVILATYNGFGQAQASILASSTVSAQAQAYIYTPQISRPIADLSNDGWVRVVI